MRTIIAVLIALTSVLGAFVAWRASVASGAASGAETKGLADALAAERTRSGILSTLNTTYSDFIRSKAYGALSKTLAQAERHATGRDAVQLDADSQAYAGLRKILMAGVTADAVMPDGSLALDRAFRLEWELAQRQQDLDSETDFVAADEARQKSEKLVGLTALLIAAALFFTLAEISRTRAFRAYLAGGAVVLIVAMALFAAVELR